MVGVRCQIHIQALIKPPTQLFPCFAGTHAGMNWTEGLLYDCEMDCFSIPYHSVKLILINYYREGNLLIYNKIYMIY